MRHRGALCRQEGCDPRQMPRSPLPCGHGLELRPSSSLLISHVCSCLLLGEGQLERADLCSASLCVFIDMMPCPSSTLVGDTLYFHSSFMSILEYQLGAQRVSIINQPPQPSFQNRDIVLMSTEDGGLGFMDVEEDESSLCLRLWSREAASGIDGVTKWARGRAIELEKLLPNGALPSPRWASDPHSRFPSVQLLGFAEGTDVIFVATWSPNHPGALYMVQLISGRARKVFDQRTIVIPYTSLCIPVTDASSTEELGDNASGA